MASPREHLCSAHDSAGYCRVHGDHEVITCTPGKLVCLPSQCGCRRAVGLDKEGTPCPRHARLGEELNSMPRFPRFLEARCLTHPLSSGQGRTCRVVPNLLGVTKLPDKLILSPGTDTHTGTHTKASWPPPQQGEPSPSLRIPMKEGLISSGGRNLRLPHQF